MIKYELNWKNFDWRNFQILCIRIAETLIPDCQFQEYLKQGHKQEGIDLLSFDKADGTAVTIQCKSVKAIVKSDLENIIQEFLKGSFREKTSRFILCTTSSLQTSKLQEIVSSYREDFRKNHNIIFETWDIDFIETHLSDFWNIVAYFFGREEAERFCYPQLNPDAFSNIKPVPHYIPRKITSFSNNNASDNLIWHFAKKQLTDLKALFIVDRLKTNHICLIGDAYQGKSYYLKQSAWELKNSGYRIQSLLVEIKEQNVQPLETLLDRSFGAWRNIPYKDLVLFIDGLDEVPTDKFSEMIKYIMEFCRLNTSVSIVLSCRRLFFNLYNVGNTLNHFDIYELYFLQTEDIDFYLKNRLGDLFNDFKDEIHKSGVSGMLHHPFYLTTLTEEFLRPPHKIPTSKSALIETFIQRTFENSKARQLKSGHQLEQKSYHFKNAIQKFAFGLQLAGKNAFTQEEIKQLFTPDEEELLQHNSLISISGNSWSFINAMFQEHLAALLLSRMSFDEIISYCSVGNSIRKIKTKWIQTLSSLIALLEPSDELFKRLLQFIEDDNIEIIFQTESSKYSNELKFSALEKLIGKCIKLNIRPMIVYEESIGIFIKDVPGCMDYLMDCIADEGITERIKIVCCRIIKNALLTPEQQKRFIDISLGQLEITDDGYYAGHLVEVLSAYKLGDKALVEKLLSFEKLNTSHEFRDNVYELLTILELVDNFYFYGLKGIECLIEHNKKITYAGSDRNLEEFLLSTNNPVHLSLLVNKNKNEKWMDYMHYRSSDKKHFSHRLFQKCELVFSQDPTIIVSIAQYIKYLGKKYLREDYKEVDDFLINTQSHWLVVRLLIHDIFNDNNWELGSLITFDSFDYLLYEFEEGNYDIFKLRSCFHWLNRKQSEEMAESFYKLCMDATERRFEIIPDRSYLDYHEKELQKRKNDLIYIKSVEAFKKGLVNYFKAYGKNSIPDNDLLVEDESVDIRHNVDSHFIFRFLVQWKIDGFKVIKLSDCLKTLDFPSYFDDMRAAEILKYPYNDNNAKDIMIPLLEDYYQKKVPAANFENSTWEDKDGPWQLWRENLLGEIFLKHKFKTPEKYLIDMVWLDRGGTRSFGHADLNKVDSISKLIIEQLTPSGLNKFKRKIVENINKGVKLESVLGNHFALCKRLKIVEAKESILHFIEQSDSYNINRMDAVDIYLELGGEKENLLSVFKSCTDYNQYFFLHLMSVFYKSHPRQTCEAGLLAIESNKTTVENKITISKFLGELGEIKGFIFLVDQIRDNKRSPYTIQSGHHVFNVDTKLGLEDLKDVMYLVIDREHNDDKRFYDTAKSILIEWIVGFAAKSELDMEMVMAFLQSVKTDLLEKYDEALDINWYINTILENFRGSDKTLKTVKEIKQIISGIEM